jgi:hypothetical protein
MAKKKEETLGTTVDIAGALKKDKPEKQEKQEKAKKNPLIDRIVSIKTRAQKTKVPWSLELEKKMESSTTIGQVKRLWRDYIRAHDQKATV